MIVGECAERSSRIMPENCNACPIVPCTCSMVQYRYYVQYCMFVCVDNFACFGLQIHVGTTNSKSKMEAMYFPASLITANESITLPPDIILNDSKNTIPFVNNFRYLGACITLDLTENNETTAHINKAKSQMGLLRHFFTCKDVDRRVKYWVYATRPLNTLLWGSKSWNLNEHNMKKL